MLLRILAITASAVLISQQALAQGIGWLHSPPMVQCGKFKKQPDGSWTSTPDAMWGPAKFGNISGIRPGVYNVNGSDVGAVLNANCAAPSSDKGAAKHGPRGKGTSSPKAASPS